MERLRPGGLLPEVGSPLPLAEAAAQEGDLQKTSRETVRTAGGAERGKGTQRKHPDVYALRERRLSGGKAARTGGRNGHGCGFSIS